MGLVSNSIINRSNIPVSSLSTSSSSASSTIKIKLETPISAMDLKNRASAIHSLCFPVLSKTKHSAPCRIMFHILKDWLCYSSEDIHNKSNELKELVSERLRQSPQGDAARFEFVESIIKSETNQSVIIRQRCLSPNDIQFKPIETMDLTTGKEFVIHEELSAANCRQSVGIKVELNGNGIDSFKTYLKSLAERTGMRIFELGVYKDNDAHSAMLIHDDSNTYIVDLTLEEGVFSDIKNYLEAKNNDFNSLGDSLILNVLPEAIFADTPQSTTSSGREKRTLDDTIDSDINSIGDTQSITSFSEVDDESLLIDSENHQSKRQKFSWETNYNLYKQFKQKNNRELQRGEQFEGVTLGNWVTTQRQNYKKGCLEEGRIELLNKASFVWDVDQEKWQTNYLLYKQFKELNHRDPKKNELFKSTKLGCWCDTQRKRKNQLSQEKIETLNSLGFVWTKNPEWKTNFELYKQFKQQYNRDPEAKEQFKGINLGGWVGNQRIKYKKGNLEDSKIDLLNQVGFVWAPYELAWQKNYELYKEFKEIHNREPIKKEQFKQVVLGAWVDTQRYLYKKGSLEDRKINLLNQAEIVWAPLDYDWETNYLLYKQFKDQYNRDPKSDELIKGVNTGNWVATQRQNYKKGILDESRINLLDKAGFVWGSISSERQTNRLEWQTNYELYKQFKGIYNREPKLEEQFEGFKLGNWVHTQRKSYKKGTLDESKIDLLNQFRFVWAPDDLVWQKNYELYKQFKGIHNREPKKVDYFEHVKLGAWVCYQRDRKNQLSQEKIEKLNLLGFVWDPDKSAWQTSCDLYEKFKEIYKREPQAREQFEGINLGTWVMKQRDNNKKGKLPQEKIDKLNSIDFVWAVR